MEIQTIKLELYSGFIKEGISKEHEVDGFKCLWSYANNKSTWKFDWSGLKPFGVCGMSGYVCVNPRPSYTQFTPLKFEVDLKYPVQTIEKAATSVQDHHAIIEFSLTPRRN